MNKTAIKNFAVWARNKLIADIQYRAGLMGITAEGIVPLVEETENYQRLRTHAVQAKLLGVRFVPLATWGAEDCHLFAFDAR